MDSIYEWDEVKAETNASKHGVTFEEASTVFDDTFGSIIADPMHSVGEHRFILIGRSASRNILVVSYTERGERVRIISARLATRTERRQYEEP